ncbi:sugar ABC transporter substrate-binding protein [Paenibacillus sp. FJAT-26967]|uniref:ABC transporter substrate-binding protein n=1 Tax=Paenibacillus sp. FJAT-26967 TaxID=1729690 RepID=UPI0008381976|nr:sugar ABC transporter substrate-binding protein [Paenibacillus sp. FJAT-26967]
MMKPRKAIGTAMAVWMAGALALTACSAGETAKDPGTEGKGEIVTLTHYTQDAPDKAYVEELIPEFEKQNPGIKVKIVKAPYEQFESKLQSMVASGNAPDVTSHWGDAGFAEYYDKGMIRDMTDLLKADNFKASDYGIPDHLMDIYKVNDRTYGIPVYSYVSVLVYNKDMFDKAGLPYPPSDYEDKSWTFEKMQDYARKLTNVSKDLNKTQFGIDWGWSERDMRPLYFGTSVYPEDTFTKNGGNPASSRFNSPEVKDAYRTIYDMMHKDKSMIDPVTSKAVAGEGGDPFAAGKVGMSVGGAWLLAGSNDFGFKVGVAAIPAGKNEKIRDVLYVDPLFILKDSKHPQEALEWIKFQLTKETQEKAIELSGGTPPANALAAEKYFSTFANIDPKDVKNVYEGGIKYGTESWNHMIPGYAELNTIIKNEMEPLENGQKSVDDVMPGLQKHINEILAKRQKK